MLLLTGATGQVGSAVLRRLVAEGAEVRCLVRDPRRLGVQRVRVQIALGDLTDPPSFRNALRGVGTVVHLAGSIRDQPRGSIEEVNGIATWRMVEAAERSGVERFLFFSALGASTHHRARLIRAKALAEQAVRESRAALHRLCPFDHLRARGPVADDARAADAAAADARVRLRPGRLSADLGGGRGRLRDRLACARPARASDEHYELAGPETLSQNDMIRTVLRSLERRRGLLHVPTPLVSRMLRAAETSPRSRCAGHLG